MVEGWAVDDLLDLLTLDSILVLELYPDLGRTGYFKCSNEMVNRLREILAWSTRGNMFFIWADR